MVLNLIKSRFYLNLSKYKINESKFPIAKFEKILNVKYAGELVKKLCLYIQKRWNTNK